MKLYTFVQRNMKEILRDKVNVFFGIFFPILLLVMLTLSQSNIPVEQFPLYNLTPGIAVFGLSFISLFSGLLIAKDRSSSFMMRMKCSPMKATDFIFGYMIPFVPLAFIQTVVCYSVALCLGLTWSFLIIPCILVNTCISLFFISIGLLSGTFLTDKQVSSLLGALLTNLVAWLSGTWFDVGLVGGFFEKIANALPFIHMVDLGRNMYQGSWDLALSNFMWVCCYTIVVLCVAIYLFSKKEMRVK